MTLIISNPSQQPITVEDVPSSGTVFPSSPFTGELFLFTPFNSLYEYTGSAWVNLQSFGAFTMYVDTATGTDAAGKGTGTGADAFSTFAYALSHLPQNYGGDCTIILGSGTYYVPALVSGRTTNGYYTYVNGNLTQRVSSTATTQFYYLYSAGGGQVQTTGSSTTVNLIAGGSTSNLCVGALVIANSLRRQVTAINSSTQFTVNEAVDWSAGYAYTYNNLGTFTDSAATWNDNEHNDRLFVQNVGAPAGNPLTWTPSTSIAMFFIKDTFATSQRLQISTPVNNFFGSLNYFVYSLNTALVQTATTQVFLDGLVFRCVSLQRSAGTSWDWYNVRVMFVGCLTISLQDFRLFNCFTWFYGCAITGALTAYGIQAFGSSIGAHSAGASAGFPEADFLLQNTYFKMTGGLSQLRFENVWVNVLRSTVEHSGFYYPLLAANFCEVQFPTASSALVIVKSGGSFTTAAARAEYSSILKSIATSNFGVQDVGYAAQSSVVAAQMSYAT